jgi:P-type E1-E2 ATPase
MIALKWPDGQVTTLTHALFDFNGTLAVDGRVGHAVTARLARVAELLTCVVASADTHGTLAASGLPVRWQRVVEGREKAAIVQAWQREGGRVAVIGNGRNDVEALRLADLALVVAGQEGVHRLALEAADAVFRSPVAALDALLHPARLVATLRP